MSVNVRAQDHYVVLGVARDATPDQIKKAYRTRMRYANSDHLGPDSTTEERAEADEIAKAINVANDVLSDSVKRSQYDALTSDPDGWLTGWYPGYGTRRTQPPASSIPVPPEQEWLIGDVTVRLVFSHAEWSSQWLVATVYVAVEDLFHLQCCDGELPHDALLRQYVVVDEHGDELVRGSWLQGLQHDVRRLSAEARRNASRREWRAALEPLRHRIDSLRRSHKPVDHLTVLLYEAERKVESGRDWLRHAEPRDAVVQAIRELEKAIDVAEAADTLDVLLADLLEGRLRHPDLRYNERLLTKLRLYELRLGGEYQAPSPEAVREHYRKALQGCVMHADARLASLKLDDDEPALLEMIQEGLLELAPTEVEITGNKENPVPHPVIYGFANVDGERTPVGVVTITEAAYERLGWRHGRASQLPLLPFGIVLMVRVQVKVGQTTRLTKPCPDGKPLLNEVQRVRKGLRSPTEEVFDLRDWFMASSPLHMAGW